MSSPLPLAVPPSLIPEEDIEPKNNAENGEDDPEEGEGDNVMSDDSSEEPEEDATITGATDSTTLCAWF